MNVLKSSGHALSAQDDRAISALLVSYGCAIDRRDWEKLRGCFSDDCECDYGSFGKWTGPGAITTYMRQAHADIGATLHRISNIEIAIEGGKAQARSYVDALLMPINAGGPVHHGIGHYEDQLIRTGAGWRIARRHFIPTFLD